MSADEKVVLLSVRSRPARIAGFVTPAVLSAAVSALHIGVFWAAIVGLAAAVCAMMGLLCAMLADGYAIQSERAQRRGRRPASWQR